jgi:hypothetical protein
MKEMMMTEAEWLACTEPDPMLEFLRGKASDRKLRWFAAACCHTIWHLLTDERSRRAVDVLERFADGEAPGSELSAVAQDAHSAAEAADHAENPYAAWTAANAVGAGQLDEDADLNTGGAPDALKDAKDTAFSAAWAIGHAAHPHDSGDAWYAKTKAHEAGESNLLRDIFGNPFWPSPPLPSSHLAWNDGTIPRLAEAIYEERKLPEGTFDTARLAILADALLDAGCEDEALIQHCRSEGPHVRGCWAVDLLTGRE